MRRRGHAKQDAEPKKLRSTSQREPRRQRSSEGTSRRDQGAKQTAGETRE